MSRKKKEIIEIEEGPTAIEIVQIRDRSRVPLRIDRNTVYLYRKRIKALSMLKNIQKDLNITEIFTDKN